MFGHNINRNEDVTIAYRLMYNCTTFRIEDRGLFYSLLKLCLLNSFASRSFGTRIFCRNPFLFLSVFRLRRKLSGDIPKHVCPLSFVIQEF